MNLREICKERLLSDMVRSVVPQVGSGWKVLIVDHNSMRIISAACKMYDVMEENVTGKSAPPMIQVTSLNITMLVQWLKILLLLDNHYQTWRLSTS